MAADRDDADEGELLWQAWDARSRDLVEARVGLAQAVAALTEELAGRRREAEAAQAESASLRRATEAVQAESAALREHAHELAARLERANADLERMRRRRAIRYVAAARRLIDRARTRAR